MVVGTVLDKPSWEFLLSVLLHHTWSVLTREDKGLARSLAPPLLKVWYHVSLSHSLSHLPFLSVSSFLSPPPPPRYHFYHFHSLIFVLLLTSSFSFSFTISFPYPSLSSSFSPFLVPLSRVHYFPSSPNNINMHTHSLTSYRRCWYVS